jgi:hypothetical protein
MIALVKTTVSRVSNAPVEALSGILNIAAYLDCHTSNTAESKDFSRSDLRYFYK